MTSALRGFSQTLIYSDKGRQKNPKFCERHIYPPPPHMHISPFCIKKTRTFESAAIEPQKGPHGEAEAVEQFVGV